MNVIIVVRGHTPHSVEAQNAKNVRQVLLLKLSHLLVLYALLDILQKRAINIVTCAVQELIH
jgi:hypothetical protein